MLRYRMAIIGAMEHRMLYVNNIETSVTIPLDDALADGPREGILHVRPHGNLLRMLTTIGVFEDIMALYKNASVKLHSSADLLVITTSRLRTHDMNDFARCG